MALQPARILSLQPYYGGSHRAFLEGWIRHSGHDWTVWTLPPRHWKWRMRHAAVHFAELVSDKNPVVPFDAIFCTDFLNVAEFRGLATESIRSLPLVTYFHENQFAYPSRRYDERDLHFGFTNFTSCVAANQVWFNSRFNQESFFSGLGKACQKWPDFPPHGAIQSIQSKCSIQPPGIELPKSRDHSSSPGNKCLNIVWAARWEHDKNPSLLLNSLQALEKRNVTFRISVLGESFRRVPEEFDQIRNHFSDKIEHWGFRESREEYWRILQGADVFVSTADHEFFGISVAEAIIAGAIPMVPDRLAYPELLKVTDDPIRRSLFMYDGSAADFAGKLEFLSRHRDEDQVQHQRQSLRHQLTAELSWQTRASQMDEQIGKLCAEAT